MHPNNNAYWQAAQVFYLPDLVSTPFKLRRVWSLWNLCLSIFSMIGVSRTVPHLLNELRQHGFHHTICSEPSSWYQRDAVGTWVSLFVYSKIPELFDTLFLILQKKRVPFLHWFHHGMHYSVLHLHENGSQFTDTPLALRATQSLSYCIVGTHTQPQRQLVYTFLRSTTASIL